MNITYLTKLQENPVKGSFSNEPLSLNEIQQLENLYFSGNSFPKALAEMLFLAGQYCIVLDFGDNDNQQELQDYVRSKMINKNKSINRPFYVIDIYNATDQFVFVYLDEGENPSVYEAHYYDDQNWITKIDDSLSKFIFDLINRVIQGRNPY